MIFTGEFITICTFLTIPILYETSRSFRYYFKFFVYYLYIMVASIFVIPIFIWKPRAVENLVLASKICQFASRILGLHWEVHGQEHLEKDEACVIVCNHQSSIDVLGVTELIPIMRKCTIVAKKELFYAWPFGLAAWLCGLIFIDRLNALTSRHAINSCIEQLKKDKVKLWVFPEGTRRNTGEIHLFKKGAFYAAVNGQIPLLPIVFTQFYFTQGRPTKNLETGRIVVTVLPPISTDGLTTADIPLLMTQTRDMMINTFNQTSQNVQALCHGDKAD